MVAALRAAYPDYSPTHLICAVQTVAMMWANSVTLAERKAERGGAPVYMYLMTWETPVARGGLKSPHALEIPLVFDNVETLATSSAGARIPSDGRPDGPGVARFRAHGQPNTAGAPTWPAYDAGDPRDDGVRPGEPGGERSAGRGSARPVVGMSPLIRPAELSRSGGRKVIFSLF